MITKATETAGEVEQKTEEMVGEATGEVGRVVKEVAPGMAQIIALMLGVGCAVVAAIALLFTVAII
jgi:hypothetical protein